MVKVRRFADFVCFVLDTCKFNHQMMTVYFIHLQIYSLNRVFDCLSTLFRTTIFLQILKYIVYFELSIMTANFQQIETYQMNIREKRLKYFYSSSIRRITQVQTKSVYSPHFGNHYCDTRSPVYICDVRHYYNCDKVVNDQITIAINLQSSK